MVDGNTVGFQRIRFRDIGLLGSARADLVNTLTLAPGAIGYTFQKSDEDYPWGHGNNGGGLGGSCLGMLLGQSPCEGNFGTGDIFGTPDNVCQLLWDGMCMNACAGEYNEAVADCDGVRDAVTAGGALVGGIVGGVAGAGAGGVGAAPGAVAGAGAIVGGAAGSAYRWYCARQAAARQIQCQARCTMRSIGCRP